MEFQQKLDEEMINSIRSITGIDSEIIRSVFKGLYIANLQRISSKRNSMVIPKIGYLSTFRNTDTNEITYTAVADESFNYAVKQAYSGKIVSLQELLESIINSQPTEGNDEIMHLLLTEDELMDLGLID